eukprot:4765678-Ditylum_brightwellii.AAC.2
MAAVDDMGAMTGSPGGQEEEPSGVPVRIAPNFSSKANDEEEEAIGNNKSGKLKILFWSKPVCVANSNL